MPLLVSLTSQARHFILSLIGRKLAGNEQQTLEAELFTPPAQSSGQFPVPFGVFPSSVATRHGKPFPAALSSADRLAAQKA